MLLYSQGKQIKNRKNLMGNVQDLCEEKYYRLLNNVKHMLN